MCRNMRVPKKVQRHTGIMMQLATLQKNQWFQVRTGRWPRRFNRRNIRRQKNQWFQVRTGRCLAQARNYSALNLQRQYGGIRKSMHVYSQYFACTSNEILKFRPWLEPFSWFFQFVTWYFFCWFSLFGFSYSLRLCHDQFVNIQFVNIQFVNIQFVNIQ